ncbi:unnamed protein product [Psylliodes chrysocephalus]|uniref:HTH psq-type domain-containing protein n=1 Tax=Psylliodes chrysocephalus TaxID=3402493 RepID=A0A9P0CQI3_9CUCU|nr:unnamed protein product [Psylliodes chrysocephala]
MVEKGKVEERRDEFVEKIAIKIPKNKEKKVKSYTPEDLAKPIQSIRENIYSVKNAAEVFRSPRSTLISRTKGWKNRKQSTKEIPGRSVDLSPEVEEKLALYLKTLSKWGFGLSRKEILLSGLFNHNNPDNSVDRTVVKESIFRPNDLQENFIKQITNNAQEEALPVRDIEVEGERDLESRMDSEDDMEPVPSNSKSPIPYTSKGPITSFESLLIEQIATENKDATSGKTEIFGNRRIIDPFFYPALLELIENDDQFITNNIPETTPFCTDCSAVFGSKVSRSMDRKKKKY